VEDEDAAIHDALAWDGDVHQRVDGLVEAGVGVAVASAVVTTTVVLGGLLLRGLVAAGLLVATVVAAAILRECREGRGVVRDGQVGVFLDTPRLIENDPDVLNRLVTLGHVAHKCGIDPAVEPVMIHPTLHYQNGGVEINGDGATCVEGLYCARTSFTYSNDKRSSYKVFAYGDTVNRRWIEPRKGDWKLIGNAFSRNDAMHTALYQAFCVDGMPTTVEGLVQRLKERGGRHGTTLSNHDK